MKPSFGQNFLIFHPADGSLLGVKYNASFLLFQCMVYMYTKENYEGFLPFQSLCGCL